MSLLTVNEARTVARSVGLTASVAETVIRKSAGLPMATTFDVFLSHSFLDAEVIAGVARILEQDGSTVYIDWRDDPLLDRSRVTPETAEVLRKRMAKCRFLLFATSLNASYSRWMPWELGYFDGLNRGKIGVLPLMTTAFQNWVGQEYLGLYPVFERINFAGFGRRLGSWTDRAANRAETLTAAVRR